MAVRQQVMQARCDISSVLYGGLDKLVVVVGPSTVHDPRAAMEFAARLRTAAQLCAEVRSPQPGHRTHRARRERPAMSGPPVACWKELLHTMHDVMQHVMHDVMRDGRSWWWS